MWALGYPLVAVGLAVRLHFALRRPLRAFLKFRGAMVVTCPDTAQPAGVKVEWGQVLPEHLPAVLAAGRPVCWTCHVTETFRREHPELVVDRNFRRAGL
jgi:hypothetical protein